MDVMTKARQVPLGLCREHYVMCAHRKKVILLVFFTYVTATHCARPSSLTLRSDLAHRVHPQVLSYRVRPGDKEAAAWESQQHTNRQV